MFPESMDFSLDDGEQYKAALWQSGRWEMAGTAMTTREFTLWA